MQLLNRYAFFIFIALLGWSVDGYTQDYYWVNGDGDWSDFQNHWATSSNGTTFHMAPPGPGNDVYFDQNSFNGPNQSVTIDVDAEFKSMDWSGVTNNPTLQGDNTYSLNAYGSFTLSPDMSYQFEGDINFLGNNFGNTFDFSEHEIFGNITFDGNGTWNAERGENIKSYAALIFRNASSVVLDVDTIYAAAVRSFSGGTIKVDFSSTVVVLRNNPTNSSDNGLGWNVIHDSNVELNTKRVNIITNFNSFSVSNASPVEYGDIIFESTEPLLRFTDEDVDFNSLKFEHSGIIKVDRYDKSTDLVVTASIVELSGGNFLTLESGMTLTASNLIANTDCSSYAQIQSSIGGQPAFLNLAAGITLEFFALQDIQSSNAGNITLNNSLDLGGNVSGSSIGRFIFSNETKGRQLFWVGGSGGWFDESKMHWSLSSNGVPGECPPNSLDTVIFDDASFDGNPSITVNSIKTGNSEPEVAPIYFHDLIIQSNKSLELFDFTTTVNVHGSILLDPNTSFKSLRLYFNSSDLNEEIRMFNNLSSLFTFFKGKGEWNLMSELIAKTLIFNSGSLNSNSFDISLDRILISGDAPKTLKLNASYFRFSETSPWLDMWQSLSDNLFVDGGNSIVEIPAKNGVFSMRNEIFSNGNNYLNFNKVKFIYPTNPGNFGSGRILSEFDNNKINDISFKYVEFETDGIIEGAGVFDSLIFSAPKSYTFDYNNVHDIKEYWKMRGSNCSGTIDISSSEAGSNAIINSGASINVDADFVKIKDLVIIPGGINPGPNSIDEGNNQGWLFNSQGLNSSGILGENQYICQGESLILSASDNAATGYQWYSLSNGISNPLIGENSDNLEVSSDGTFSVEVFFGPCSIYDTIEIFSTDFLDSIDLGMDLTLCEGETQTFQIDIPGRDVQLQWNDNPADSLATFTAGTEGMVKLRGTFEGCIREDSIMIDFDTVVPPNLNTPTLNLCFGTSTKLPLDRSLYTSVTWTDPNGNLIPLTEDSLPINSNGTYRLTVNNNSCFLEDSVSVTILPQFTVDLGGDQTLCEGDPLSLDAGVIGATYQWTGPSLSETTKVIQPTLSGNYQVTVTVNNCTQTDDVNVTFNPTPVVNLQNEYFFCEGSSVTIAADNILISSGAVLNWSNGAAGDISGPLSSSSKLILTADLNGCDASDSTDIVEQKLPVLELGFTDTTLCQGQSITLDATQNDPSATYEWRDINAATPMAIIDAQAIYTPSNDGLYEVTASINGCSNTASGKVSFTTPPIVDLGRDTILCDGQTFTTPDLSFLNADRFIWSTTANTPSIPITTAGNYQVTVEKGGCMVQDDITVTIQPLPVFNLPNNVTLCAGDTLLLDATQNDPTTEYKWSGNFLGFLTNDPNYVVRAIDDYTIEATINNCSASQTISVSYTPIPTNLNLGPDSVLCEGQVWNIDLSNLNADEYSWNTGSRSPSEQFDSTGTYEVTITINGCSATDAVKLDFVPYPVLDLGPPDTSLCDGQTLLLDVSQGNPITTYNWIDLATSNTTIISTDSVLSIIGGGDYQITASNAECSSSSSILVNYYPYPVFDLGKDTLLCEGESVLLDPGLMTGQLEWNDQTTTPTKMVSQEGLYSLAVTVNNCTTTDSVQIDYISFTPNFLGANQSNLCEGEQIDLKVKDTFPGISYQWNDGSTAAFYEVTQTGKYWVDVEVGRCKTTDTIDFVFNPLPVFDLGTDQRLCEDETANLAINVANSNYLWSDGTSQASNTIRFPGGLVWAEAQNLYCSFRDSLFVDYDEYPNIDLGPDTTICDDRTVILSAGANAEQFAWSTGSTAPSIEVDKSGVYTLTASNGVCEITDDVEVISRECYYFNVFIPNAFSPNNDGVNDNLTPYFPIGVTVQEFSMSIFDRWGNILFQTSDINTTWDGYWNGKLMPEGVYIYYLEVSYTDDLGPGTARRNGDFILIK